ncbi:hypothetical protein O6H91_09G123800 [Diphasiastrum complanatum]|uniref:Uncharacterized protein n=1 Tax=Diphasiastrum complanatum TaxID=34168 RepID=A0ACC2CU49_DIPCM|nr:hypothetical protein O6H91_09G123800 [Diphasiastrum complanatum]
MALSMDVDSLGARLMHAITITIASPSSSSRSDQPPLQALADLVKERGSQSAFSCSRCKARLIRGVETSVCIACGALQPLAIGKSSQFSYKQSHAFQSFLQSLAPKDVENDLANTTNKDRGAGRDKAVKFVISESPSVQASWDFTHQRSKNQTLSVATGGNGDNLQASINVDRFPLEHSSSFGDFEKAGASDESPMAKPKGLKGPEKSFPEDNLLSSLTQKYNSNMVKDVQSTPNFKNLDDLFLNVKEVKSDAAPKPLMLREENWKQPSLKHDLDLLFQASNSGTGHSSSAASSKKEMWNETNIDSFESFFPLGKVEQERNVQQGSDLIDITPLESEIEAMPFVDNFSDLESWARKSSSTIPSSANSFLIEELEKGSSLFTSQHEVDSKTFDAMAALGQTNTGESSGAMEEAWDEDDVQWTSATTSTELAFTTSNSSINNQVVASDDFLTFQPSSQYSEHENRHTEVCGGTVKDMFQPTSDESRSLFLETNANLGGLQKTILEANSTASFANGNHGAWEPSVKLQDLPEVAPKRPTLDGESMKELADIPPRLDAPFFSIIFI